MTVIEFVIVSLCSPCVSFMLWDWMQKDMILQIAGNWVNKEIYHNSDIAEKIKILQDEKTPEAEEAISHLRNTELKVKRYKKPLGACLKCFHVWVFLALNIAVIYTQLPIYLSLLGVSYVILVKLFYK